MTDTLIEIIREKRLQSLFQPILDLSSGHVHGHEGLIRGPSDSVFHSPIVLLRGADQAGRRGEMEMLCVAIIVAEFVRLGLEGDLFINLSPAILCEATDRRAELLALLDTRGLSPGRVVIELTEDGVPPDERTLLERLGEYRAAGLRIALDDLGEGYSSLRRWSELRPQYVKIDKHFVSGLNQDPIKLQFVRSMQQMAANTGARMIAEGIETRAEFNLAREIGIAYGQGYFIGRPAASPTLTLEVLDAIAAPAPAGTQPTSAYHVQAGRLLNEAPTLDPDDSNETALKHFIDNPKLHALAVTRGGKPIGLINRYKLIDLFSRVFIRELHGKRSCIQFMDPAPLLVDKTTPIEELSKLVILKGKSTFTDGFVITENGDYLGLGSGFDLMETVMQLQLITARYSNPLTQLPGNVPINNQIEQLLESGAPFWVAYCDLDHFKPYNDIYGYEQGDSMILGLSDALKERVDPSRDFLGHIGGDDFIVLFRSEDWEARCHDILKNFADRAKALCMPTHVDEGGYYSEDRCGRTVFHPIPSLSIGVVQADAAQYRSHHEISAAAAVAKKQAKKILGNSLFVERRQASAPPEHGEARGVANVVARETNPVTDFSSLVNTAVIASP